MSTTEDNEGLSLFKIRKLFNLTQAEVASILECTQSRISKIDKHVIELPLLKKLVEEKGGTLVVIVDVDDTTSVRFPI
jgi:predicted XRE-type DNA-binding protein